MLSPFRFRPFQYVDEVVIGPPLAVSAELLDHFKVAKVFRGSRDASERVSANAAADALCLCVCVCVSVCLSVSVSVCLSVRVCGQEPTLTRLGTAHKGTK